MSRKAQETTGHEIQQIAALFRQHLEDHHHIKTDKEFDAGSVREHLEGEHTVLPVSVFGSRLSALESIVKYLRENEGLRNNQVAALLGRTPASVWITYRNACRKMGKQIVVGDSEVFVPTTVIASKRLSVLEGIALYLHDEYILSYKKIGLLLKRDERTIWTVCNRARKKLGR
jgi:DNA-directed RNA polymerase specialized sigma24 family protein